LSAEFNTKANCSGLLLAVIEEANKFEGDRHDVDPHSCNRTR